MNGFEIEPLNHDITHFFTGHELIIESLLIPDRVIIIVDCESYDVDLNPYRHDVTPNFLLKDMKVMSEDNPGIQYRAPHANKPGDEPWKRRRR